MYSTVEDQGTMLVRLQNVENGVRELDKKVAQIDDKVSHSINIQGEMATNIGEQFSSLRHQMSDQEKMIKKWQKQTMGNWFTNIKFYISLLGFIGWWLLMIWLWQH
tara:strand:- start:903 stop:1220 length:318 start_codon:yes stop_codon:yes gene_type:complete